MSKFLFGSFFFFQWFLSLFNFAHVLFSGVMQKCVCNVVWFTELLQDILDSWSGSSCVSISLKFVSFLVSMTLHDPSVDVSPSEEVSTLIFFID